MQKEVNVSKVKCEHCKRIVKAEANIGYSYRSDGKKTILSNNIYTYWGCEFHGAVRGFLNEKLICTPSDLFEYMNVGFETRKTE